MAPTLRLRRELSELVATKSEHLQNIAAVDDNLMTWTALLVPQNAPYNKGAFRIALHFPPQYPFVPPKVNFNTKIYHPNVDQDGNACLSIISSDKWKPATRVRDVLKDLIKVLQDPEPEHALRSDVGEEFATKHELFMKTAEKFTKKHAEQRPA